MFAEGPSWAIQRAAKFYPCACIIHRFLPPCFPSVQSRLEKLPTAAAGDTFADRCRSPDRRRYQVAISPEKQTNHFYHFAVHLAMPPRTPSRLSCVAIGARSEAHPATCPRLDIWAGQHVLWAVPNCVTLSWRCMSVRGIPRSLSVPTTPHIGVVQGLL